MTARQALDMALDIMNERREDGTYNVDMADLEKNAVSCLSIITVSLYELDCRIRDVVCVYDDNTPPAVMSLEDELTLHPAICRGVVPYGLAFMLLLEEEPNRAEALHTLYEKEVYKLERLHNKGKRRRIREVY